MTQLASVAAIVPGAAVPELVVTIDREALVRFAGAADDYVAQHWDHPFMIAAGYPDVIVHGWLVFAHLNRAVTDWAPPDIARVAAYAVRYVRPMFPGELRCEGEVVRVDEGGAHLALRALDGAGDVVATATMTLVPS